MKQCSKSQVKYTAATETGRNYAITKKVKILIFRKCKLWRPPDFHPPGRSLQKERVFMAYATYLTHLFEFKSKHYAYIYCMYLIHIT